MQDVIWNGRPTFRKPVMVCAFNGWNDAGEAASAAVSFIRDSFDAEEFASIDPEEFFDFTAVRPTVRLTEGITREIDWPVATISGAPVPGAEGDLVGRLREGVTTLCPSLAPDQLGATQLPEDGLDEFPRQPLLTHDRVDLHSLGPPVEIW